MKDFDIHVVPMMLSFGDDLFLETELSMESFVERLQSSKELPKSSQPAIGSFIELYERLQNDYDMAIAIHVSSGLSGTVSTSQVAADIVGFPVYVVDSGIASFPMAKMVMDSVSLYRNGASHKEILSFLDSSKTRFDAYLLLDNLEQLHRGGRMSGSQFFIGNFLKIKPILRVSDYVVKPYEKLRGSARATKRMFEIFDQAIREHPHLQVAVLYCGKESDALVWVNQLKDSYPQVHVFPYPLSSAVGVHTGAGTLGLAWVY